MPGSLSILLVEDDPIHARIIRSALHECGPSDCVVHMRDGASALTYLHDEVSLPNLVLMDLQLPDMDGFDAVRSIKNSSRMKQLPVIVLSTSDRFEDVQRSYDAGANAYISKPADFEELTRRLNVCRTFWAEVAQLPGRVK